MPGKRKAIGPMNNDQDLLQRVADGDQGAMRQLFERYQTTLFAFLRSKGADAQAADDAIQDAMLDVWRTAGRFSGGSSVKTWLFTIARNKFIDRMRKAGKVSLYDELPEIEDDSPDAETVLTSAADAARVRACLSTLKPAHLTAIRLAFYEDLTYSEIGRIEDISEGTVKTRIFHAKKLLLRCLGRR